MDIELSMARLPQGRSKLVEVLAKAGDVVRISDVSQVLGLSRIEAAKRLARWREQGWLNRVGSGAYVPATLETLGEERVLDDGWILVPTLFSPAYVGGRTAAEHWDLTEQIFKDVVVITSRAIRQKRLSRQGFDFTLKHMNEDMIFGTKAVWRRRSKVAVSDVHRTLVDMLNDPALGGGIQQVSDCVKAYFKRADRSDQKLIEYAERLGNGAIFKRLGFLAERSGNETGLVEASLSRITAGNAKFDPAQKCPRLVSKWRLFVPEIWFDGAPA